MKPTVTWIVVADGDRAKLFENDGPGKGLRALKNLSFEQEPLAARDIMTDRPGRSGGAAPGSRAAVEYRTDPVELRERRFLEHLADILDQKHNEGAFDRLVIAAAPAALGELRPALSDGVRETIVAEMPKDLTNVPMPKLAEHLDGVLAV